MNNLETATFGGGCFWCTEAIFKRLKGVEGVVSGYAGGTRKDPTYEQVSTGVTGHAEVVQIDFDPSIVSYKILLEIFFHLHDPTTLNRQGADEGSQYRSVIFYHSDLQRDEAELMRDEVADSGEYIDPIVTQIVPFEHFYTAEEYHQNFYDTNPNQGYCSYIVSPKLKKLLSKYSQFVKDEYLQKT